MALHHHSGARKAVESWDDDLDLEGNLHTAAPKQPRNPSISLSSRHSMRSESNAGEDDWQVPVNVNDDTGKLEAMRSAKTAGIPLPDNVPASALVGGTIQRLGRKKSRKNFDDDWANDLQLPDAGTEPLKLKKPVATPTANDNTSFDELEDWGEGSLGIRHAGTRKTSHPRDSSASGVSPSMGSAFTFESEEDGLDGLVLPTGPVDFQAALKKRKANDPPQGGAVSREQSLEDGFDDIDFGPGDVFDPKKRALNKNVKHSMQTPYRSSPQTKPMTTLTFTDKPNSTRLPRPAGAVRPSRLEPVLEAGATIGRSRRFDTANAATQALRAKRSMPALRQHQLNKQPSAPSLTTTTQATRATPRVQAHTRQTSDPQGRASPTPRPTSLIRQQGPETPTRPKRHVAPASLTREAVTRQSVTQPLRRRHYGNGTELDMFDDLPTSAAKERQYVKQPSSKPPPPGLRTTASQRSLVNRDKTSTPVPSTPRSPTRPAENLPRFARDTAASRIAREQTLGSTAHQALSSKRSESVLAARTNWSAQPANRSPHASPSVHRHAKKGPTLINPIGKENSRHFQEDAARKGMRWNATLLRWEGNEAAVRHFDPTMTPSRTANRANQSPPRPALITNIASGQAGQPNIQVVGGMVFDPTKMCWLKMGRGRAGSVASNPLSPADEQTEDDDDPFKDIEDLPEDTHKRASSVYGGAQNYTDATASVPSASEGLHEEFDLGPIFVARQREEESAWQLRIGAWFSPEYSAQRRADGDGWKWAIVEEARRVDQALLQGGASLEPAVEL